MSTTRSSAPIHGRWIAPDGVSGSSSRHLFLLGWVPGALVKESWHPGPPRSLQIILITEQQKWPQFSTPLCVFPLQCDSAAPPIRRQSLFPPLKFWPIKFNKREDVSVLSLRPQEACKLGSCHCHDSKPKIVCWLIRDNMEDIPSELASATLDQPKAGQPSNMW